MIRSSFLLLLSFVVSVGMPAQQALQMPPKSAAPPVPRPALAHPTLDHIRSVNAVTCGVSKEEEDYSRGEDHGNRAAFDIDLCKAVAVATLGTGAHLVIKSFPDEAFAVRALRAGEVDLVATASLAVAHTAQDLAFSAPVLLDGQGFVVPKSAGAHTPLDLAGKKVCFLTGSVAEDGLHSYAAAHHITYVWYPFSEAGEMEAAFFTANCDAVSSDLTSLANIRAIDPRRAHEFTILPETIRPDPLGMATWAGDPRFASIVYWTVEALLGAEQRSITQSGVATAGTSTDPELQGFLGQRLGTGAMLGLRDHWVAEVIAAVGNYGELWERDLGSGSALALERGNNCLVTSGGELAVVPLREH